jgi:death-on-curing protein
MSLFTFSVEMVIAIHDDVLNPGELPGLALDKSLAGTLGRVENRIAYGLIQDVFDLAAAYAVAISQGHCFNDGNKRTAFRVMEAALGLNGIVMAFETAEIGQTIIRTAQRQLDEGELADWLRDRT